MTGLDASPRLIAHAARTLPEGHWAVGDMRDLDLGRTFDGLLVWHSLFHLTPEDQRRALDRILAHAAPSASLMMTVPVEAAVQIGEWRGEALYHASLGGPVYEAILADAGFMQDPADEHAPSARAGAWLFRPAAAA